MPLYRVVRPMGGPVDESEIEASAYRANSCVANFKSMEWTRSYLDRESWTFSCYYRANSEADIREHARLSQIPCDTVTEVDEYTPDRFG